MSKKQQVRVLYFTVYPAGSFEKGGGALAIWYAADALVKHSNIKLSIAFVGELTDEVKKRFKNRAELISLKNKEELLEVVQEVSPDIFHGMLPSSEGAINFCKNNHIPIVYEVRSAKCFPCKFLHKLKPPYHREWKQMLRGRADRKVAALADLIIAPSLTAQMALEKFYDIPEERSIALYNGVNREIFYPGSGRKRGDGIVRIINAGRVERDRNFDLVIAAFIQLKKQLPEERLELVLVGDGSQRENIELLAEKIDGVRVVGAVSPKHLAELYRSADFLLNASESESFGNVVAEAMSCGLPVVCFAAGSLVELVVDKETGFLCDLYDQESLVILAEKLIKNEELRGRMGESALKRALDNFSWEKRAVTMVGLYQQLLQR